MKLSCKQASRLLSEAMDRELALTERLALRVHIAICTACKRVEKQLEVLRRAVAKLPPEDRPPGSDAGA